MNWFAKIAVQGEWWIQDSVAIFADGDIGDTNHEGEAIFNARNSIMSSSGIDINQYDDEPYDELWEQWKQAAVQEHLSEKGIPEDQWENHDEEDVLMEVLRELQVSDEEYQMAEGMGDVRLYAMKAWGWKRVQGSNVETWSLTSGDINSIGHGLWDAYQEEAEQTKFSIYVMSNDQWFDDVPWAVLSDGNPMAMREYRRMSGVDPNAVAFR